MAAEIFIGGMPLNRQVRQETLPQPATSLQPALPDEEVLVFPPERRVDAHGNVLYTVIPGEIPQAAREGLVTDIEPPRTIQRDGTPVPTSRGRVAIMNQFLSEKARGVVVALSPFEQDFRAKIAPDNSRAFGRWPFWRLTTRDRIELYNVVKDWVTWVFIAPIAYFGAKGVSNYRIDADVRFQVNEQTIQYSELFLDPYRNAGGARLLQMVENNQGGRDLNDRDSWGKDSNLWSVARGITGFWKGVGDYNSRKSLIDKLPVGGVARTVLEGMGSKNLSDDEVRVFLQNKGILPANATLMQELVEEFVSGNGEVASAFNSAKGRNKK